MPNLGYPMTCVPVKCALARKSLFKMGHHFLCAFYSAGKIRISKKSIFKKVKLMLALKGLLILLLGGTMHDLIREPELSRSVRSAARSCDCSLQLQRL